jgi:hypothetical protein
LLEYDHQRATLSKDSGDFRSGRRGPNHGNHMPRRFVFCVRHKVYLIIVCRRIVQTQIRGAASSLCLARVELAWFP